MYDDIPIVPNLYEAPANPQIKDCYYNITLDKYYVYDGTQWLEAKTEEELSEDQDGFELKYSSDDGETFITENYTDFDSLCVRMDSSTLQQATNVIITMPFSPAVLVPRTSDTSLDGVALLKLKSKISEIKDIFTLTYSKDEGTTFITEEYDNFYDLIARTNSSVMQGVTDIEVSMTETEDSNLVTYDENFKDVFCLRYSTNHGKTFITEGYDNFQALTNRTHNNDMSTVTDISISMEKESDYVVGKIYPKIIFNQKLVENLYTNGTETFNSVFDGVLVHYKPYADIKYNIGTDYDGNPFTDGQMIHTYFTIINTGSFPLYNITVSSEFSGDEGNIETLPVGDSHEFDAAQSVGQADIDAGNLPWDFSYEAEYEDSNGDIQTISGSIIYNIHPIQYKISYRVDLNTDYTEQNVIGIDNVVNLIQTLDATTVKDLKIEEQEGEEAE